MESLESWFEDFGEGRLLCSEASIALDPDFAAVVDPTKYHVFLTGLDGVFDLSAADKTPQGFRVSRDGHLHALTGPYLVLANLHL